MPVIPTPPPPGPQPVIFQNITTRTSKPIILPTANPTAPSILNISHKTLILRGRAGQVPIRALATTVVAVNDIVVVARACGDGVEIASAGGVVAEMAEPDDAREGGGAETWGLVCVCGIGERGRKTSDDDPATAMGNASTLGGLLWG